MALQAAEKREGCIAIPRGVVPGTPRRRVLAAYELGSEIGQIGTQLQHIAPAAPLLIQLRNAHLASPEIRESVREKYKGEVLNMAIGPGKGGKVRVISPVERFFYDEEHGWVAEGTERRQRELPAGDQWQAPDGDVLWDEDGLPSRTLADRKAAVKAWEVALEKANIDPEYAEDFASYLWRRNEYNDFAAAYRCSDPDDGLWLLNLHCGPDDGYADVGVRPVSGLPSAEREAGPEKRRLPKGYVIGEKTYDSLKGYLERASEISPEATKLLGALKKKAKRI